MTETGESEASTGRVAGSEVSRVGTHGHNPSLQLSSTKLNGNNYLAWSRACLLSVKASSMYGYLTGEISEPTTLGPDKCKWISEDALVMSWLFNSMEPTIRDSFLLLNTAHEVWTAVAQTYSQTGNDAQAYELRKKPRDTAQKELSCLPSDKKD